MNTGASVQAYTVQSRLLIRACDRVALATRMATGGQAYVSLAAVATDLDATPLLLLSSLSDHTRNILAEPQVNI